MEKLVQISTYPKVGVNIQTTGDQFIRVTLCLSSAFILQCASKRVQETMIPWLQRYCQGQWTLFPIPPLRTSFHQKTASFLQTILPGQVISYLELAKSVGHPRAARAVGNFCRGNLFPLFVPCHRVIPTCGQLGAFTPSPLIKQQLLEFEGVFIN